LPEPKRSPSNTFQQNAANNYAGMLIRVSSNGI